MGEKVERLGEENKGLQRDLGDKENDLAGKVSEITKLKNKQKTLTGLKEQVERLGEENKGLQRDLGDKENDLAGKVSEITTLKNNLVDLNKKLKDQTIIENTQAPPYQFEKTT